ncbi:MAG TPA: hypothetical protein VES97_04135 [Solirubrobacteraceae bacterium]|nr:hypothetical protein [Solirubrobacteraceae bacterium]
MSRDITTIAAQVWQFTVGVDWPRDWRVRWHRNLRAYLGVTDYKRKVIYVSPVPLGPGDGKIGPLEVLLHEFVHLVCPNEYHGNQFFIWLEDALRQRLALPSRAESNRLRAAQARIDERLAKRALLLSCGFPLETADRWAGLASAESSSA